MVEAVAGKNLPTFTTVKYTTKDGENITATKKDGMVTLVGDKNGVRQMPIDDFVKKELVENIENIKLENSPEKDTVELSTKTETATPTDDKTNVAQNPEVKTEVAPNTNQPEVGKKLDVAA